MIELLIVIVIISTLAAISAPTYLKIIERFRVLEATRTIYETKKAQEEVKLRKGNYTNKFEDLTIEILDENNNPCTSDKCQLKYFNLQRKIVLEYLHKGDQTKSHHLKDIVQTTYIFMIH